MNTPVSIEVTALRLRLRKPFRIAHGSSHERLNALVRIGDYYGEAALPPYYPCTIDDIASYASSLDLDLDLDPEAGYFGIHSVIDSLPDGPSQARAAVDMALFDAWGKSLKQPLYRLLGLDPGRCPMSSFAISIPTSIDDYREEIESLGSWPILKLKVGSGSLEFDEEIVRTAGSSFSGILCIDANSAWSISQALDIIPRLDDLGLLFIEQPIHTEDRDDWHLLRRMLPNLVTPLIADESVQNVDDIIALSGAADGINLKLAKCGGIHSMQRMIHIARGLDMLVMIGCMIESGLATTAAAHLSPLADFVDLDAAEQLSDNPFTGVHLADGIITLPTSPGLGVTDVRPSFHN